MLDGKAIAFSNSMEIRRFLTLFNFPQLCDCCRELNIVHTDTVKRDLIEHIISQY